MKVVVSGSIGLGKKSLCQSLSKHITNSHLIEEKFDFGDLLSKFYHQQQTSEKLSSHNKYAMPLQLAYLKSRFDNEMESLKLKNRVVIQERCLFEDRLIFAEALRKTESMNKVEFEEYLTKYDKKISLVQPPSVLILLRTALIAQESLIKVKGNNLETLISSNYLKALDNEYHSYIKNMRALCPKTKMVVLDPGSLSKDELFKAALKEIV